MQVYIGLCYFEKIGTVDGTFGTVIGTVDGTVNFPEIWYFKIKNKGKLSTISNESIELQIHVVEVVKIVFLKKVNSRLLIIGDI